MELEKRKEFIINLAYWLVIALIIFAVLKYAAGLLAPFLIALIVSAAMRPLVRYLHRRFRIKKSVSAVILSLALYALLILFTVLLGVRLISAVVGLFAKLPAFYTQSIVPELASIYQSAETLAENYGYSFADALDSVFPQLISSAGSMVTSVSTSAVGYLTGLATKIPNFLLMLLMTIIATVFLSADYDRVMAFFMRNIPVRAREIVLDVKQALIKIIGRYGKSYAIIMFMTFAEVYIGYLILRVQNALLLAVITALVDIFPIVGTGTVLLPWAVFSLIQGKYGLGIGIAVIYLVVTIVRQTMEPRIIGTHVGLHPLATLLSMFVGLKLFGFVGLLGLPISLAILTSLHDSGAIRPFRFFGDK